MRHSNNSRANNSRANNRSHNNRNNNRNHNANRNRNRQHNNHNKGNKQNNGSFDSHGPQERVRGKARQVYEKYLTLATEARRVNNRVLAESYFQHAEHYLRLIPPTPAPAVKNDAQKKQNKTQNQNPQKHNNTAQTTETKENQPQNTPHDDTENKPKKIRKTRRGNRRKSNNPEAKQPDLLDNVTETKTDKTAEMAIGKIEAKPTPKTVEEPKKKAPAKTRTRRKKAEPKKEAAEDRSAVDALMTRPVKRKKSDDTKDAESTE